jgi:hypothetical protein
MRPANMVLLAIIFMCSYPVAQAIEEGAIAQPSMPVPNMDMPKPVIKAPATGLTDEKSNGQSADNNSSPAPNEADDAISGKWTIRFEDLRDRSLDLTLWSSGKDKIMGYGTLTKNGAEISMTASGSLRENELAMVVKSGQAELGSADYCQYDLDMLVENSTLSGTYTLSSGTGASINGNVTAIKR